MVAIRFNSNNEINMLTSNENSSSIEEDRSETMQQIQAMSPWHMNIQLDNGLNTGQAFSEDGRNLDLSQNEGITLLHLRDSFLGQMDKIYPDGLAGKRFLDCACNAGGYCFWAGERGVDNAFGFDVRDHWIDQAKFVQTKRTSAAPGQLQFDVCDLYDLPSRNLQPSEITMFKGIFYHLPDPIAGLKIAADLTTELLYFNTSTVWGEKDGYLKCGWECREHVMSGVHGLRWFPTGPQVIVEILNWLGFVEVKQTFNVQDANLPHLGRIELIASKKPGLLANLNGESLFGSDTAK